MAEFKLTEDGRNLVINKGLKGKEGKLALSTLTAEEVAANAKLTSEKVPGEITGTGYAQQVEAAIPESTTELIKLAQKEWNTGAATNWPAAVKSCHLIVESKIVCAVNLRPEGKARDLSGANTTEKFTLTLEI